MSPRVAVTTSADGLHRVGRFLEERGLTAVPLPCIRIEPSPAIVLEALRREARAADWIVVTSARAIRILWPDGDMPPVPVAAVGTSTARAVTEAGGVVEMVGEGGASVLAESLSGRVGGATIVFPHARAADPGTALALSAAGATVVAEPVYDTVPIAPASDPVDAVLFGSPSALEGWLGARSLDALVVAAMGDTTAAAIRRAGREPDLVPSVPSLASVADALAARLLEGVHP